MSSTVTIKASGLNISPNQLEVQPGSLTVANNIIIKRDNTVESRRGFKYYGSAFPGINDTAKQLISYQSRILRHYNSTLQYDSDDAGTFISFNGVFNEPTSGIRIKSIESNGNLYFTTANGIQKISAFTASDFTNQAGFITPAGGIKALDLTSRLAVTLGSSSGFLPQDSAVAYRVVWGTNDNNNNEILGTPSQRSEVYNPLLSLDLQDYSHLLGALDNIAPSGLIDNGNYVSTLNLPITASATQLYNNLVSLAVKIDNDILYADQVLAPLQISTVNVSSNVVTVTFSSGTVTNYIHAGSHVYLTGFKDSASKSLDGPQLVTSVTATTLVFAATATNGAGTLTSATIVSNEFRNQLLVTSYPQPALPPTDQDLVNIQNTLLAFIGILQTFPNAVITTAALNAFIIPLNVTTSANVILNITIPQAVTSNYFLQVYRSSITQATGTTVLADLVPNDEMKLIYEAYPTTAELAAETIQITDITPDAFAGTFLYSNQVSGEGALQTNDVPPSAIDINRFKNYTFYANTQTRQRLLVSLLGVVNMVNNFNISTPPKLTITDGTKTNTYTFITGVNQQTNITCTAGSTLVAAASPASYFTLNNANNNTLYYVWYKIGSSIDPAVSGRVGIQVNALAGDTATQIAAKTGDTIAQYITDFNTSSSTPTVTIVNTTAGYTNSPTMGTSGFTFTIPVSGRGENASINQVLLSSLVSPAEAVDETARSLVRVINKNTSEGVFGYYLSAATTVPGKMLFEGRNLTENTFYMVADSGITGASFNPDLSPTGQITSIVNSGGYALVTTAVSHGMLNQAKVVLSSTNSTANIDGLYTITYVSANSFKVNGTITISGTSGSFIPATSAQQSQNEKKANRLYYSKLQQPEAVPVVNYIDIGEENKAIIRIFPLIDSLFVFKEDGLWRVSGEIAPFVTNRFDTSVVLIAPDSLSFANNIIYGWAIQGITTVTESGAGIISRPIDQDILKLASSSYPNFKTVTWGVGYDSDNSYVVYTNSQTTDTVATIGYRYSNLTNSWTNFILSTTCGIVFDGDDRLYMGDGKTNYIRQERKSFSRYDYADIDFAAILTTNNLVGNTMLLNDVSNISVGDVITQDQLLTVYTYNQLLYKLDTDTQLNTNTFYSSLHASAGDDLRVKIVALASKLDGILGGTTYSDLIAPYSGSNINSISIANPTVITTAAAHNLVNNRYVELFGSNSNPSVDGNYVVTVLSPTTFSIPVNVNLTAGTAANYTTLINDFSDINACYNAIIGQLNIDNNVAFSNYSLSLITTTQEAIVTAVNSNIRQITLNLALPYVPGSLTVFKSIPTDFAYCPNMMGDPLSLKHFSEVTMMFETKAFTSAVMSFASDLLPQRIAVPFNGDGNGIFGFSAFGSGYFGGGSNSAPFRTYVPAQCQRCRYLVLSYQHSIAREKWSIFGLTLTGNISSTRGYR